jgi:hypothetical protein
LSTKASSFSVADADARGRTASPAMDTGEPTGEPTASRLTGSGGVRATSSESFASFVRKRSVGSAVAQ